MSRGGALRLNNGSNSAGSPSRGAFRRFLRQSGQIVAPGETICQCIVRGRIASEAMTEQPHWLHVHSIAEPPWHLVRAQPGRHVVRSVAGKSVAPRLRRRPTRVRFSCNPWFRRERVSKARFSACELHQEPPQMRPCSLGRRPNARRRDEAGERHEAIPEVPLRHPAGGWPAGCLCRGNATTPRDDDHDHDHVPSRQDSFERRNVPLAHLARAPALRAGLLRSAGCAASSRRSALGRIGARLANRSPAARRTRSPTWPT